jgi:endogenous inhibitor of DNA gyrase (YacG/DUF329 family)
MAQRLVNCPRCGAKAEWSTGNPWRPFCSEHCKMIDLGAWASESYRIPVVELDDGEDPDMPSDGPAIN